MEVFVCKFEHRLIDIGTIADLTHFTSIVVSE